MPLDVLLLAGGAPCPRLGVYTKSAGFGAIGSSPGATSSKVPFYISYVGLSGVLQGSDLDAIMSVGRAFFRKDASLTRLGVCKRARPLDGGVTAVKKYPRMVPFYMYLPVQIIEPSGYMKLSMNVVRF